MAKATQSSTAVQATYASVDFASYKPGADYPFSFHVIAGTTGDNFIRGPADKCCDSAVEMALYILTAAVGFEGLKEEEREKLRELAAAEPYWGYRRGADRISQARAEAAARRISATAASCSPSDESSEISDGLSDISDLKVVA